MSYRDDLREIRTRLHWMEAQLSPIQIGVESAAASALLARAGAQLRAADRLLAAALCERLDAMQGADALAFDASIDAIAKAVGASAGAGSAVAQAFAR